MIKVSVVIPAKNEELSIGNVVSDIFSTFSNKPKSLQNYHLSEVLVINDGSSDGTEIKASEAGATVVTHHYSKGNGAAVKTGARKAVGDIFVFMDADGQHQPKDILHLIQKIDDGYDLAIGSRSKESQASIGRSWANKFYNKFASYMTGHKVEDLTSGFRAVRADRFKEFIYLLPNGFSYPTTSTMAFFRAGYSVTYVPIHPPKRSGKSHINPLKDGIRFLLIIFKVGTLYSPLKLFLPISLVVFITGLAYYGYTCITMTGFTNMSALMFTTSLIIFMVGLVSEQITALMYKQEN